MLILFLEVALTRWEWKLKYRSFFLFLGLELAWGSLLISSIYDKEFPLFQSIMISLLLIYALWRISYDTFTLLLWNTMISHRERCAMHSGWNWYWCNLICLVQVSRQFVWLLSRLPFALYVSAMRVTLQWKTYQIMKWFECVVTQVNYEH